VSGTRGRVWLEALPGYAPDLNPCLLPRTTVVILIYVDLYL